MHAGRQINIVFFKIRGKRLKCLCIGENGCDVMSKKRESLPENTENVRLDKCDFILKCVYISLISPRYCRGEHRVTDHFEIRTTSKR